MIINFKDELLNILKEINKSEKDIKASAIFIDDNSEEGGCMDIYRHLGINMKLLDFNTSEGSVADEIYGLILFNDNSWVERSKYIYEGVFRWSFNKVPTITDVLNFGKVKYV